MNEIQWKIRIKLNIIAFFLATAATLCFPQILNLKDNGLVFTNSIFSVLVWVLCYYAVNLSLHTIDLQDRRGWWLAGILSFLFTTAMLFGTRLDYVENVDFKDLGLWISLPVLTALFTVLVRKFWNFLGNLEERKAQAMEQLGTRRECKMKESTRCVITFFLLLACWLPVLLAVYPGFFVYDAQEEYLQVASRVFTTHHPLAHVLLLGGIICAVHKVTGSYNLGIACYMVFQMLLVSGVFTYLLAYLRKKKVSAGFRFFSLLYFAFFPVIVMFTLCSAKDTIFTAALLLLLVSMLEFGIEGESFCDDRKKMALFMGSALVMMLFRKNGVYAYLVLLPVIFLFHRKMAVKANKKTVLLFVLPLVGYLLLNSALTVALQAEDSENQEMLTVPIQQLARTYKYSPETFTEEDREILHEVLSEDALSLYNARLSDPVKYYFNNQAYAKDKTRYAKLWLRIGLRKPLSYLNAWLMTSYGFWYPDTVINVYAGNSVFTFTYENCSYFGYEVELPGVRASKIPWLDEMYRKLSLEIQQEKIPIFSMLFSPGCLFWCFAFAFSYVLYRRKYHIVMPYFLVLLLWLTVILGPTYLPRYVLIFWFGLPLLAAILLQEQCFSCKKDTSVIY